MQLTRVVCSRACALIRCPPAGADALLLPLPAVASILSVERLLESATLGDALVSASGALLAKLCRYAAECRSQLASEARAMRRLLLTTVELLQHDKHEVAVPPPPPRIQAMRRLPFLHPSPCLPLPSRPSPRHYHPSHTPPTKLGSTIHQVRADALTVVEELAADGATYGALLQTGALQNILDLLERTAVAAAGLTADAATAGTDAAARATRLAEGERRGALRFLAALVHQDVTLTALFEDHPALDGVVLPGHDAVQARRESAFGHHANFARAAVREGKVGGGGGGGGGVGGDGAPVGVRAASLGGPPPIAAGGATVRKGASRPPVAPVYERPSY